MREGFSSSGWRLSPCPLLPLPLASPVYRSNWKGAKGHAERKAAAEAENGEPSSGAKGQPRLTT